MVRKRKKISVTKFLGVNEKADFSQMLSGEARVIKNYRVTGDYSVKKRDGFCFLPQLYHMGKIIYKVWHASRNGLPCLYYIADDKLYAYDYDDKPPFFIGTIGSGEASMFLYGGFVYILNGTNYYRYDGTTLTVVEGYVPTVLIGSSPDGKGTAFEDINLLTSKVAQQYNGNGSSTVFKLGKQGVLSVSSVKVGSNAVGFSYDGTNNSVTLSSPPPEGTNNITIIYNLSGASRQKIVGCNRSVFCGGGNDTRLMVWGNADAMDSCYFSELANGNPNIEYFPEPNFLSLSGHKISDIVRHYDRQIILTDKGAFYSYDSTVTDALGTVRNVFPTFTLSSQKGNLAPGQAAVIDNYPVTIWHDGIYKWVSTNIRDERNAELISERVNESFKRIVSQNNFRCLMLDCENRGELWVVGGGEALIYNYRLDLWYVFTNINISCITAVGNEIWFGTVDGKIGRFNKQITSDNGAAIGCFLETPFISFGDRKMELRDITIMHAGASDRTDIYWRSDDQSGDVMPFRAGVTAVGLGPTIDELRIGAKRVGALKLILISDTMDTGSHIVSLTLGIKG